MCAGTKSSFGRMTHAPDGNRAALENVGLPRRFRGGNDRRVSAPSAGDEFPRCPGCAIKGMTWWKSSTVLKRSVLDVSHALIS